MRKGRRDRGEREDGMEEIERAGKKGKERRVEERERRRGRGREGEREREKEKGKESGR